MAGSFTLEKVTVLTKGGCKNILITGASDGLGLRLAHLFAKDGANLLLCGRRTSDKLKLPLPTNAHYLVADHSRPDCPEIILKKVQQLGWERIDNMILAAGTGQTGPAVDQSKDLISQSVSVNLVSPILIVHAFSGYLLGEQDSLSASLTFIGSTAAKGAADFATYSASKAGLAGFARSLSSEWKNRVDVQIIHPGPTATGMHEKIGYDAGFVKKFFINPDYSARKIKKLIERRKPIGVVGFRSRAFDFLKSGLGLGISTKPIIS